MGWTFSERWTSRKEMLDYLRRPDRFIQGYTMLRSSVVGNHHWYLVRREQDGFVSIGLDLMKGSKPGYPGWGYKDLDETMGPCDVDCPIGFLKLVSAPEGYAAEFRQKVLQYHANKAKRHKPSAGMSVSYGGQTYRLERPAGPRKGWVVLRENGQACRMTARQLSEALQTLPEEKADVGVSTISNERMPTIQGNLVLT